MNNFSYFLGQRDCISGLLATARSFYEKSECLENACEKAIEDLLKPYQDWDTFSYFSEKIEGNLQEVDCLAYDLGQLCTINFCRASKISPLETIKYLHNQYLIHFESKTQDNSDKNPHVKWFLEKIKNEGC